DVTAAHPVAVLGWWCLRVDSWRGVESRATTPPTRCTDPPKPASTSHTPYKADTPTTAPTPPTRQAGPTSARPQPPPPPPVASPNADTPPTPPPDHRLSDPTHPDTHPAPTTAPCPHPTPRSLPGAPHPPR